MIFALMILDDYTTVTLCKLTLCLVSDKLNIHDHT